MEKRSQKSYFCKKLRVLNFKVRLLEDDPAFDAGKGSVLTKEGQVKIWFAFFLQRICYIF